MTTLRDTSLSSDCQAAIRAGDLNCVLKAETDEVSKVRNHGKEKMFWRNSFDVDLDRMRNQTKLPLRPQSLQMESGLSAIDHPT